jgi:hypothetical protein
MRGEKVEVGCWGDAPARTVAGVSMLA